jgi:hypothetical protein
MKAFPHLCFVCANLWPKTPLGGEDSGSGFPGLDFNLVAVSEELSAEAKGFPLQGQVDEFKGLPGLVLGGTRGDLTGIELKVEPADGDGLHALSRLTKAYAASLLRMPITSVVAGGTGWANTTLQIVFTQPWCPMRPTTGVHQSFSA